MPLFEVETTAHIMIACAEDEATARQFATANYPSEQIIRVSHRPRDAWVISKNLLGIASKIDPCSKARECLAHAQGDKLHAVRLYMKETGCGLEEAQDHRVEHGHRLVRESSPFCAGQSRRPSRPSDAIPAAGRWRFLSSW